jgi:DtxR family transcriptional regulator, Mn-dependent transcriptional regulator
MTTPTVDLTEAVQDYLKAIYALEAAGERVTVTALSRHLGVSAPSATEMSKRMAELGLVLRTPYRRLALTAAGRREALSVLRRHRLLERYLADRLGVPLDEVHGEAERLEHAISPRVEARLDELLGFPALDPHGDPIPDRGLRVEQGGARTVADLHAGEEATVAHVPDRDPELLRYLTALELVPGRAVALLQLAPFGGPALVRTAAGEHAIARELAAAIGVS